MTEHSTVDTPRAKSVWGRGVLAAAIVAVVNVVVALVARAVFGVDSDFQALQPASVLLASIVACLAGVAVYLLIRRTLQSPDRKFSILAWCVGLLSCASPLMLLGADPSEMPGVSDAAALSLVPLHILPVPILLAVLLRRRA